MSELEYTENEIKQALNQAVEQGLLTMFIKDGAAYYVESRELDELGKLDELPDDDMEAS